MGDIKRVATTAVTSAAVGFAVKASPLLIKGAATEWVTTGAIGVIGLAGAFMSKGKTCEDISIGAINGVTAILGTKMAEMIQPKATTTPTTTPAYNPSILTPMPKLVGLGDGSGARASERSAVRSSMYL